MNILIPCFTLFTLVVVGEACICEPKHPQTAYCEAGFVIEATIKSNEQSTKEQDGLPRDYYQVLVNHVYKGDMLLGEEKAIYTSENEPSCKVAFTVGKKYLITGRKVNETLQVNSCDWIIEHSKLTKTMKRGLTKKYKCGNDDCKIHYCFKNSCVDSDGCNWILGDKKRFNQCTNKHKFCMKKKNGKCAWSKNKSYYNVCAAFLSLNVDEETGESGKSCTCPQKHIAETYCEAKFVIEATIKSNGPSTKEQDGLPRDYYQVLVDRVYKGDMLQGEEKAIYTSETEPSCKVAFTVGTKYLITGRKGDEILQVNSCDWIEEYSKLDRNTKRGLKWLASKK